MTGKLPKGKEIIVCTQLPTKPECSTRVFYSGDCTQIKTHLQKVQKILSLVSIPYWSASDTKQSTQAGKA